jgi:hypothetical protein
MFIGQIYIYSKNENRRLLTKESNTHPTPMMIITWRPKGPSEYSFQDMAGR